MSSISSRLSLHRTGFSNPFFGFNFTSPFIPCAMSEALRLTGHRGCVNTCSFNPYGNMQLTGCDDGCVWLWDIGKRAQTPILRLRPHVTNVFTTNFLSGNRFLSGGNDASVHVMEVSNDGRVHDTTYANHHLRKVLSSFVIDENTFSTCSHDCTVRLFDIRTSYRCQSHAEIPVLTEGDFDYNAHERLGHDLYAHNIASQGAGGGSSVRADSEPDGASLLLDFQHEIDAELYTMDVHPIDRKIFITSGSDGTVRLFDMRMIRRGTPGGLGFSVNPRYRRTMSVTGAAFDDRGERIAATVIDGNIHVLQTDSFARLSEIPRHVPNYDAPFRAFRRAPGFQVHWAGHEGEDEDVEPAEEAPARATGEIIELTGHRSAHTYKTCNWFGDFVVTGSDDGRVYFYDSHSGDIVNILWGHRNPVNVVAVHTEKKLLATSGVDYFAVLWEPRMISKVDRAQIDQEVRDREEDEEDMTYQRACMVM
jgi:WD40 repeat protein